MKKILAFFAFLPLLPLAACNDSGPAPTPPPVANQTWSIAGAFDGKPVVVTADRAHGGAVFSLKWDGFEFVNADDNGRELQTAFTLNGHGESENPTEAGAGTDPPGRSSTAVDAANTADNKIHTFVHMAYWKPFGGQITSPHTLSKTVTIGYNGLPNVLYHQITVGIVGPQQSVNMEGLTLYSPLVFTRFFIFDLSSGTTTEIPAPKAMLYNQANPTVIATADLSHAITLYGRNNFYHYGGAIGGGGVAWPKLDCCSYQSAATPAGDYAWEAFTVFGSLDQVTQTLKALK